MKVVSMMLLVAVALLACSGPVYNGPRGSVDPSKETILIGVIAGSSTPFKEELISKCMEFYGGSFNVIAKEIKTPADLQGESYKAVIVMDTLKAWLMFNGKLKKIAKQADKQKTIFYVSVGDPKWRWKRDDIKLITSATQKSDVEDSFKDIQTMMGSVLR